MKKFERKIWKPKRLEAILDFLDKAKDGLFSVELSFSSNVGKVSPLFTHTI